MWHLQRMKQDSIIESNTHTHSQHGHCLWEKESVTHASSIFLVCLSRGAQPFGKSFMIRQKKIIVSLNKNELRFMLLDN